MSTQAMLKSGEEPPIQTMLADPSVRMLMDKDGENPEGVHALLVRTAKERRARGWSL